MTTVIDSRPKIKECTYMYTYYIVQRRGQQAAHYKVNCQKLFHIVAQSTEAL